MNQNIFSKIFFFQIKITVHIFSLGFHVWEFSQSGLDKVGWGDVRESWQGILQMLARTQEKLQPKQEVKQMNRRKGFEFLYFTWKRSIENCHDLNDVVVNLVLL